MEINKNSKTARFVHWYTKRDDWDDMPKSLCSYFWTVIFSVLTFPVGVLFKDLLNKTHDNAISEGSSISAPLKYLTGFVVSGIVYLLLCSLGYAIYWGEYMGVEEIELAFSVLYPQYFLLGVGLLAAIIAIAFLLVTIGYQIFDSDSYIRTSISHKTESTKTGNLTVNYIKSTKNKVCPIIKYKDS